MARESLLASTDAPFAQLAAKPNNIRCGTRTTKTDKVDVHPAATNVTLVPVGLNPAWIRSGEPKTAITPLWKSDDRTATGLIWECTAESFDWHDPEEETVHIPEGDVYVQEVGGKTFRLDAGDSAVSKAGAHAVWTVPNRVRKIGICRWELPPAVTLPARA